MRRGAATVAAPLAACLCLLACKQEGKRAQTDQPILAQPTKPARTGDTPEIATGQPLAPAPLPGLPAVAGEISELVQSANRKMMHGDGTGCLADLDAIAKQNPSLDKSLLVTRAQCEMLVGNCQRGKQTIADYYEREMAMSRERAEITAEQIGSMRCRSGDMTDRDRLLRALFELSDGAYMNKREASDCQTNIALVKELAPKVPPRDPDDGQVRGGPTALFHTGAACLARAGDCDAAFRCYSENYPAAIQAIKDPTVRRQTIEDGFRSSIERCKEATLPGAGSGGTGRAGNTNDTDPLQGRK